MTAARPLRDATVATLGLLAAIHAGSGGLTRLDPALLGYLAATVAAGFATVYRMSAFWRRPASAFYVRTLLGTVRHPRRLGQMLRGAARDLAAQRFIARRSRARWLAHLLLSGGTLASFAITLPLVWGWLHFEAEEQRTYRAFFLSIPVTRFAVDGAVGWLVFHALSLAAVTVVFGSAYFLVVRLRARRQPGTTGGFHLSPLLLLLVVALTGLALPVAGRSGSPGLFQAAATVHEVSVIVLLLALPFSKLAHLLIRPLQLGVQVVRAPGVPRVSCAGCGAALAPAAQRDAVEGLLEARGFRLAGYQRRCPACRRRQVAAAQAELLGAQFQPRPAGTRASGETA
ncbi:MAG: hypothetical protein E6J71_05590 [Deltaproteobacteria bacterium]|nr:MAG: hypothetical protein E6J77_11385 [Deltaproteobacteria bacterium]TMB22615.1 MAG: hypothetical protein E6J71_05590 [Deltaproteobacteria bacterium]